MATETGAVVAAVTVVVAGNNGGMQHSTTSDSTVAKTAVVAVEGTEQQWWQCLSIDNDNYWGRECKECLSGWNMLTMMGLLQTVTLPLPPTTMRVSHRGQQRHTTIKKRYVESRKSRGGGGSGKGVLTHGIRQRGEKGGGGYSGGNDNSAVHALLDKVAQ